MEAFVFVMNVGTLNLTRSPGKGQLSDHGLWRVWVSCGLATSRLETLVAVQEIQRLVCDADSNLSWVTEAIASKRLFFSSGL